jgi:glycosyltransferase involved in cell wall biosynthesis
MAGLNTNFHRVLILQEHLPHYRVPFFEKLRSTLNDLGISLQLVYSEAGVSRLLPGKLPWARPVATIRCGGLVYQHVVAFVAKADLVIVPQEVKYVSLAYLFARRNTGSIKLAFWGHGRNMQARNRNSWPEKIKRFVSKRVDWWFAYNAASAAIVKELGFPEERITLVNNSIDTNALIAAHKALSPEAIESAKASLGIDSSNVAIYTGGLYEAKRIPFLLEAAAKIRARLPDFHLIIIGGGPHAKMVQKAADSSTWIHFLGPKNDLEKIPYWAISKVSLMPGLVGLGVLDSFALGVPLITTAYPYHSPEIQYLTDGLNGMIVRDWESVDAYADTVVTLLTHDDLRESMAGEGRKAADLYTIENMADNFANGILKALQIPGEPAHT